MSSDHLRQLDRKLSGCLTYHDELTTRARELLPATRRLAFDPDAELVRLGAADFLELTQSVAACLHGLTLFSRLQALRGLFAESQEEGTPVDRDEVDSLVLEIVEALPELRGEFGLE